MPKSLIALPLPDAMAEIEAADEQVARVIVTAPPGAPQAAGIPRVVRERKTLEGIELTVAVPISALGDADHA